MITIQRLALGLLFFVVFVALGRLYLITPSGDPKMWWPIAILASLAVVAILAPQWRAGRGVGQGRPR